MRKTVDVIYCDAEGKCRSFRARPDKNGLRIGIKTWRAQRIPFDVRFYADPFDGHEAGSYVTLNIYDGARWCNYRSAAGVWDVRITKAVRRA